jgi:predicted ATP-dependent endonuclease of OLD family
MYISQIRIKNYRNFIDNTFQFNPGMNVIIGHNNSGKTNVIRALQLVFDRDYKNKPKIEDFNRNNIDFSTPPKIEISVYIDEYNDKDEDKNVVYDWLIKDSPEYTAQLTYVFELPTKHHEEYNILIEECKDDNDEFIQDECLRVIDKKLLPKYVSRIYGGYPSKQEKVEIENLERFDFQFLDAIRDAESQMFYGNNTILRDVLYYFLDYDLTEGQGYENLSQETQNELKKRENEFKENSTNLLESLIGRIDDDKILQYSKETGANKGGDPNFDAEITEQELLFALRLIVEKSGFKIPIKNNGLGYNNLLFIALVLAKMQMYSSSFMGDNAKIFPILAIEEPEAHLHPSMQSKFLKFLNNNLKESNQARQIFISSHSTHITSAVGLNSIICLYEDYKGEYRIGYPSKTFENNDNGYSSKIYVERFLDATKSNMLFAERIIFVEGLAEQLLLPCFAEYLNKEDELIDKHVSIISVDSRTFKHFLKLFSYDKEQNPYAINKKVVCITDADPAIKKNNRWISTFPYLLDSSENSMALSSHVNDLVKKYHEKYSNIDVFHPEEGLGKTLEYDLARFNPTTSLLITDAFPKQNSPHTKSNYENLIENYEQGFNQLIKKYKEFLKIDNIEEDVILRNITNKEWDEEKKKNALIASIYYRIVSTIKGEHAFYLEKQLRENYQKGNEKLDFIPPAYIKSAINKILE